MTSNFAHRQRLGDEIAGYAHEIKTYALAKLGELLSVMPKAGGPGVAGPGRGKTGSRSELVLQRETYAELGLDKKTAAVAQRRGFQDDRSVNLKQSAEDVAAALGTTVKQISRWRKKYDDRAEMLAQLHTSGGTVSPTGSRGMSPRLPPESRFPTSGDAGVIGPPWIAACVSTLRPVARTFSHRPGGHHEHRTVASTR